MRSPTCAARWRVGQGALSELVRHFVGAAPLFAQMLEQLPVGLDVSRVYGDNAIEPAPCLINAQL
ncbi:hypothetical protein Raf01_94440 [Rugosimonospora africana]|uniref:Uncharacterized protein n=1 Tax=Rugosimonospora africana TaxID=556532 RepID=A0A8J3R4E4_9ACTN|nr:hypothetical protein Raf01_94440 [Rugosimonospora africana]